MRNAEEDLRKRLVKVCRLLWDNNLVYGTAGNVSARIFGSSKCVIKPSGFRMCDIKPDDFIVIDIYTREVLSGRHKPSIETPLHTTIYKMRDDVGGVVHTHSYYATVFSIARVELVPMGTVVYTAPLLAKGVGITEYAPPGTEQLALNVVSELKNKNAVLMPHHGVVTVGRDIEEAYLIAKGVEDLAKLQYRVMQIGKPQPLPDSTLKDILKKSRSDSTKDSAVL